MRAIGLVLLASIAFGRAAVAQDVGNATNTDSETRDLSGITFNLAAPAYGKTERLPEAATLGELSSGAQSRAVVRPEAESTKISPKPPAKLGKPAPRPAPKVVSTTPAPGAPMSAWRRAYIAKHHHQPPVPAR